MKIIVFDVMCRGKFIMQHKYRWCPLFQLDMEEVLKEILERRPSLKGKPIELFETENIVSPKR